MPRIRRKQRPPVLAEYRKYKPYLRIDFQYRCAYCHIPELRYGPPGNYSIDHFRPKSRPEFSHLVSRYANLYYACQDCNRHKGKTWPAPQLRADGFRFLDPCKDDYNEHWRVRPSGEIEAFTRAAEYMIGRLGLNCAYLIDWRRKKGSLIAYIERLERLIHVLTPGTQEHNDTSEFVQHLRLQLGDEYGDLW